MRLIELLKRGYFPSELPPPFHTESFGDHYEEVKYIWDDLDSSVKNLYSETKQFSFSIPKVGFSRRLLGIPNPIHFATLSEVIVSNWNDIQKIYDGSKLSASKPTFNQGEGRALKPLVSYGDFRKKCIIDSFDKIYELKTDISKYYPSIYTHTISWAIHSKSTAKANRKNPSFLGNNLDRCIQHGQHGQTIGIPIGPDTSFVISEIIGCTIDKLVKTKFPFIKGYRFFDDYNLYFSTQADAENVFKYLQSELNEYTLMLNEEKTIINKFPFEFEANWTILLNDFEISQNPKTKANDLFNFVSLAFKFSKMSAKDSVLKWAIKKMAAIQIENENWDLFESLIFKMTLVEPALLPDLCRILVTYSKLVSKRKLARLIKELLLIHIPKSHSFEVSWTLWIAKSFMIKIPKKTATKIFDSTDFISILIALDLRASKLITASAKNLIKELELSSFKDERWLLAYESIYKKWLQPISTSLLLKSKYFMALKKCNVSFYDAERQVKKIDFSKSRKAPQKSYNKADEIIAEGRIKDLFKNKKALNIIKEEEINFLGTKLTNFGLDYTENNE